jgi:hypothetical protein
MKLLLPFAGISLLALNAANRSVRVTPTSGYGCSGAGVGAERLGRQLRRDLAPGGETEILERGTGGTPSNMVRLLVSVDGDAKDGCSYIPSRRYSHKLGVF